MAPVDRSRIAAVLVDDGIRAGQEADGAELVPVEVPDAGDFDPEPESEDDVLEDDEPDEEDADDAAVDDELDEAEPEVPRESVR